jgi:hypothetical protein
MPSNFQFLCTACHRRKSLADELQFGQPADRWDCCIECRCMLSKGPGSCRHCHFYRAAPIIGWLVRTGRVSRGPAPRPRDRASASPPPPTHTSEAVLGDRISAL